MCPGSFLWQVKFQGRFSEPVASSKTRLTFQCEGKRQLQSRLIQPKRIQPMRLKLFVTATFLVTGSIAAFPQTDEPNTAPPTIGDVQKLVDTISGDKAKLKAFCELGTLYEQIEKAEEKNDAKEVNALGVKIGSLEQQVGPDYRQIMDGVGEVDPNSAEGQRLTAIFEPLQEKCK